MSIVDPTPENVLTERSSVDRSSQGVFSIGIVIAIALGVALAMWATTRTLLAEWSDTGNLTYTHGYLIVAVSLWSIVRSRATISRLPLAPRPWLAAILLAISVAWLVAYQAGLLVVHQALLPIAMWFAIYTICGWAIAREAAFGIAYLYFAIPVWSLLNSTLQSATTSAMKASLPLFGVPTYFSGNTVYIPSGVFEIAGGCSGLHYFIVGLAIAALYGEMHRDSLKTRTLLLVGSALLSIIANWVRVFSIIVAGHLTDMQHFLVKVDHYYFGWFVFAVTMMIFFFWASRMPQSVNKDTSHEAAFTPPTRGRIWWTAILAALAIALGPVRAAQARANPSPHVVSLPELSGPWSGPHAPDGDWQPKFSRADASIQGTYGVGPQQVEVFLAHYRDQRQGKELNSASNSVLGETMRPRGPRKPIQGHFGERIIESADGTQWVLWDRYQVGSRSFYSPTIGQLWYGAASVRTVLPSSVLAVRSRCVPNCDAARKTNEEFIHVSVFAEQIIQ